MFWRAILPKESVAGEVNLDVRLKVICSIVGLYEAGKIPASIVVWRYRP